MAMKKISVSLDPDVVAQATAAARSEGRSLSAWLNEVARKALRIEQGLKAMDDWEREHGPFTDEQTAAAEALIARFKNGLSGES